MSFDVSKIHCCHGHLSYFFLSFHPYSPKYSGFHEIGADADIVASKIRRHSTCQTYAKEVSGIHPGTMVLYEDKADGRWSKFRYCLVPLAYLDHLELGVLHKIRCLSLSCIVCKRQREFDEKFGAVACSLSNPSDEYLSRNEEFLLSVIPQAGRSGCWPRRHYRSNS